MKSRFQGDRFESRDRWWKCGYPEQSVANLRGASRLRLRRKRLLPMGLSGRDSPPGYVVALIVAAALLMPILTLRYGAAVKRGIAEWRGGDPKETIVERVRHADSAAAVAKLLPMLRREPFAPEVLRELAWAARDRFPKEAMMLFHRLVDLGQADYADEMALGELLAEQGDYEKAQRVLSKVMLRHRQLVEPWIQAGKVAIASGDRIKAEGALEAAIQMKPDSVEAVCLLAQLHDQGDSIEDRVAATSKLLDLTTTCIREGRPDDVKQLGRVFIRLAATDPSQRQQFVDLVKNHSLDAPDLQLACAAMSFSGAANDSEREALCAEWRNLLSHWKDDHAVAIALAWLQDQGEHDLILELTDGHEFHQGAEVATLRMASLLAGGRVKAAALMAAHPLAPASGVQPSILAAFEAFRIVETPEELSLRLLGVLERLEAGADAREYYVIGTLALLSGSADLAERALLSSLRAAPEWPVPVRAYFSAIRQSGGKASQALADLTAQPTLASSLELRKGIAYLRLLGAHRVSWTEAEIGQILAARPSDPYLRMLMALARHQQADHAGAARWLTPLENHRWHQGEAAVIVSIMASAGQVDETRQIASALQPKGMLKEEKQMVMPWLERLAQTTESRSGALLSVR